MPELSVGIAQIVERRLAVGIEAQRPQEIVDRSHHIPVIAAVAQIDVGAHRLGGLLGGVSPQRMFILPHPVALYRYKGQQGDQSSSPPTPSPHLLHRSESDQRQSKTDQGKIEPVFVYQDIERQKGRGQSNKTPPQSHGQGLPTPCSPLENERSVSAAPGRLYRRPAPTRATDKGVVHAQMGGQRQELGIVDKPFDLRGQLLWQGAHGLPQHRPFERPAHGGQVGNCHDGKGQDRFNDLFK